MFRRHGRRVRIRCVAPVGAHSGEGPPCKERSNTPSTATCCSDRATGRWPERGKQIIAGFAAKLAPTQQNKILVSGYTDNAPIGPALQRQGITSNEILSQKRAENVMEYVVSLGVKPDLVSAQGFGDSNPIASNDTAQGRAQNRRVELSLAGSSC